MEKTKVKERMELIKSRRKRNILKLIEGKDTMKGN